jgi:DNA repair protein RecO (recombination protein O)
VLYQAYQILLQTLQEKHAVEPALRRFEHVLLAELGYALDTEMDCRSGEPLADSQAYYFHPEHGFSIAKANLPAEMGIDREVLTALRNQDFTRQETAKAVKMIHARAITHLLGGRELKSRQLFRDFVSKRT